MKTIKIVTVIALVLITVVARQAPASAHRDCVYDVHDKACVSANHKVGWVCDNERDGHRVDAEFYLDDGQTVAFSDLDGAGGDCWEWTFPSPAWGMSVCEFTHYCQFEYT